MRKPLLCFLILAILALTLAGCGEAAARAASSPQRILSHEFQDDENGQIAERFFPEPQSLPPSVRSEFEYRKTPSSLLGVGYEGYYLKLVFETEAEYRDFLETAEQRWPDMTEEQRQQSYFIIGQVRFSVEDYSFRAIDLNEYGFTDEPYVGLIARCDPDRTVVFLYLWHELAGIEDISDGLGPHGYMEFYTDSWTAKEKTA